MHEGFQIPDDITRRIQEIKPTVKTERIEKSVKRILVWARKARGFTPGEMMVAVALGIWADRRGRTLDLTDDEIAESTKVAGELLVINGILTQEEILNASRLDVH